MALKNTVFVAFLFFSYVSFAQYLTDKGKSWNVLHTYRTKRTRTYEFVGDTVINDTAFRTLHYSYSEFFDSANSFFAGYIFDDHRGNVYSKYQNGETYHLYDFTAQTGDTINMGKVNATADLEFAVDSVDYTRIGGKMAKLMYMRPIDEGISNKQIWIEGIGSTLGPVEVGEIQYFNYNTTLLCSHRNDTLLYKGELWVCYYTNAPEQQKLMFNSSDNSGPGLEFLLSADYGDLDMKIKVFDMRGELVTTKKLKKGKPFVFKKLKSGIYIIQLSDSFGRVYTTKKIEI